MYRKTRAPVRAARLMYRKARAPFREARVTTVRVRRQEAAVSTESPSASARPTASTDPGSAASTDPGPTGVAPPGPTGVGASGPAGVGAPGPTGVGASGSTGVWLIGARGSVATTAIAGCAAMSAGLHPPTGLVTETPPFSGTGLPTLSSLVFGGHDTMECPLPKRAEHLAAGGVLPHGLPAAVHAELAAADAEIRPGGPLPGDSRTDDELITAFAEEIRDFAHRHRLARVVVINVASTEPAVVPGGSVEGSGEGTSAPAGSASAAVRPGSGSGGAGAGSVGSGFGPDGSGPGSGGLASGSTGAASAEGGLAFGSGGGTANSAGQALSPDAPASAERSLTSADPALDSAGSASASTGLGTNSAASPRTDAESGLGSPESAPASAEPPPASTDRLPPSSLYAAAALRAGAPYVNFTPSTGLHHPALTDLAAASRLPYAGRDGKTGQTLLRSVLGPMFAQRALAVRAWSGTNLLGGGDGAALADPAAAAAKNAGKERVLADTLGTVPEGEVHIDDVPALGDWKTAWDHIAFDGFLGTRMTLQTTWQGCDSALAAPLILDLARLLARAHEAGLDGPRPELAFYFKDPDPGASSALPDQHLALLAFADRLRETA
ncbi:inositol-3-phosphate synthase [Streptomyces sp. NPDC127108]|uniref:inositol-3-phosphate synthase n=1 Tax=Streptomyces sp. NPDC127108 TaxID=3345361 RepID=UPI00362C14BA